jgi:phosphatidylserine/phosphatidylglycerophosphate/cardiolipin synthase-like enzyme
MQQVIVIKSLPSLQLSLVVAILLILSACGALKSHSWLERAKAEDVFPGLHKASHQVALIPNGRLALKHRLRLIGSAQDSIVIQTFILSDDLIARLLLDELEQAAQRGVAVSLLVDGLLERGAEQMLARATRVPGLEARIYNPVSSVNLIGMNQRMHNKVMVVDSKIAVIGGRNIADEYYDADSRLNFLDLDIAIQGPAVMDMRTSFAEYWRHGDILESKLKEELVSVRLERDRVIEAIDASLGLGQQSLKWFEVSALAFWADPPGKPDPKSNPRSLAIRLASILSTAEEELVIQSPYFVLSANAQALFRELKKRKVKLKLSTNSLASTDNWLTYAHSLRQRRIALHKLKFQIREMRPMPEELPYYVPGWLAGAGVQVEHDVSIPILCLHSKALVLDNQIAMIGSYNLDPRSANHNTEVGVSIWDERFAQELRGLIEHQMSAANSWVVAHKPRFAPLDLTYELIEEVNAIAQSMTSLDLWPLRYSSLYELKPDGFEVESYDPHFYNEYRDMGLFPDVPLASRKKFLVEMMRTLSGAAQPLL